MHKNDTKISIQMSGHVETIIWSSLNNSKEQKSENKNDDQNSKTIQKT